MALTAAALLVAGAAACGGDDDDPAGGTGQGAGTGDGLSSPQPTDAGAGEPGSPVPLADIDLTLTSVAEADEPTALILRPGTDVLYVVEREGAVRELTVTGEGAERAYAVATDPLVDVGDDVVAGSGGGDERGLLDATFSPAGDELYVSYSVTPDGDTRVDAYTVADDAVDPGSRREVLAVPQPFTNHNGGDVEFGPDGFLYVALGDGGNSGDPEGNGQDTQALLGKVLRLDPSSPADGNGYAIPEDNPFADGEGGAPEVWLYGVRNPWRLTFAPDSGDLWIADVGQSAWEEVNLLPAADGGGAGANLGWNEMEGTHPYEGGSAPEGAIEPVFEYSHDEGCSITGGVVYDGTTVPDLAGAYLFTDYCVGALRALRVDGTEVTDDYVFEGATASEPVSFGVDAGGDAYVVSLGGDILRIDRAS